MPNFLSNNRFRNIFAPPVTPYDDAYEDIKFGPMGLESPQSQSVISSPGTPDYDPVAHMNELYKPTTDASQNFDDMIRNYPQRENPSILRRLGSMLVDYTKGPQAGQAMMDQPFTDKLTDWKNKIGPSQQAANLERYENSNSRTLAYETVSAKLRDVAQEARNRKDDAAAKVAQQRADLYKFKIDHPDYEFNYSGPKVKVADPRTGKITETEWDTGNITASDKINSNQKNALARIEASGEQAKEIERLRQTGRETIADTRGWSPPMTIEDKKNPGKMITVSIHGATGKVKEVKLDDENVGLVTKPSSASAKPETESNKKIKEYRIARELYNTRPDLRSFIHLDTSGANTFEIDTPGKGFFGGPTGPSDKQSEELKSIIYGTAAPSMAPVASHGSTNPPKAPPGWKYVRKPGGGWTAVEDKQGGEF